MLIYSSYRCIVSLRSTLRKTFAQKIPRRDNDDGDDDLKIHSGRIRWCLLFLVSVSVKMLNKIIV
jgi:hypothetical protein